MGWLYLAMFIGVATAFYWMVPTHERLALPITQRRFSRRLRHLRHALGLRGLGNGPATGQRALG